MLIDFTGTSLAQPDDFSFKIVDLFSNKDKFRFENITTSREAWLNVKKLEAIEAKLIAEGKLAAPALCTKDGGYIRVVRFFAGKAQYEEFCDLIFQHNVFNVAGAHLDGWEVQIDVKNA